MSLATQILAMLALVVFVFIIIVSHIMSSRGSLQPLDTGITFVRYYFSYHFQNYMYCTIGKQCYKSAFK